MMDPESKKFGGGKMLWTLFQVVIDPSWEKWKENGTSLKRYKHEKRKFIWKKGPRELCGAVDLINQFKLLPHHNFFCKRSLPLFVSKSHYLQNVVGDREIKKGEGMELDQLFQNIQFSRERNAFIRAFDIGLLKEAFQVRETSPIILPIAEKGFPTASLRSMRKSTKDKKKKHKILKYQNMENDHTKVKRCNKDGSNEKHKKRSGLAPDPENLKKQPDKTVQRITSFRFKQFPHEKNRSFVCGLYSETAVT